MRHYAHRREFVASHNALLKALARLGINPFQMDEWAVTISVEDYPANEHFEYYPEFQEDPYVSREIEALVNGLGYYVEWYDAGTVQLTKD